MTELQVGIKHIRDGVETQPIKGAEMSVVGIIGTAPLADTSAFPLDTPVYVTGSDTALIAKLGAWATDNTLLDAVRGVNGQLVDGSARMVIVRVTKAGSPSATIANIIGSSSAKTGIWAFTKAPNDLGFTPRLIIAPGYTSQQDTGVDTLTLTSGGTGYTSAPTVAFSGGGGTGAAATAIVAGGIVTGLTITNPGTGYTSNPTVAFSGGAGTGAAATAVKGVLANGVCAALPAVLGRLKAHAIVSGPVDSLANYQAWIETMSSARIIPGSGNDVKVMEADGTIAVRPADSRIAGLLVRRDDESDGRPFRSAANQPIYDIVGVSRAIDFSISDPSTEGQTIAGFKGGFIVRGETGVESSLSDGGFIYWGTDNLSEDANWQMYNVSRGRDYIELQQTKALRTYLGRFNITLSTVDAILNTMDAALSLALAKGDILGYSLGFERDKNTPEEIRLGHLWVKFQAEEAPVLKKITVSSQRYAKALVTLSSTIQSQIDALAG